MLVTSSYPAVLPDPSCYVHRMFMGAGTEDNPTMEVCGTGFDSYRHIVGQVRKQRGQLLAAHPPPN